MRGLWRTHPREKIYRHHTANPITQAVSNPLQFDRNKSAWWLVTFYLIPGMLGHFAKIAWSAGAIGTALQPILALAAFALSIWGFVEIGCLPGTAGPNRYGPHPVAKSTGGTAGPGIQHPANERGG
jgi:hypothetical protein